MHIQHRTLEAPGLQTISWLSDSLLADWARGGRLYSLDGQRSGDDNVRYTFGFPFDRAITSADGRYALVYQNLGTKALLLQDGKLLREINRSYYHSDDYEYPAAFATVDGTTYLLHCPLDYKRLDFEDVETGTLVTDVPSRDPQDFFHSRLEVSPGGRYLLSKGWHWHPWDAVKAYDLAACLADPRLLDRTALSPPVGTEVCTAGCLGDELVLLGTSNEEAMSEDLEAALPGESVAFWNVRTDELSAPVRVAAPFGNLFPLSETLAWDLYQHPKLLDLRTGAVVASLPELDTGHRRSSIGGGDPAIVFDRATGRVAVQGSDAIEVLSVGP